MPAGVDMIPKLSPHAGIQKPCHANTWLNLHPAEMAPCLHADLELTIIVNFGSFWVQLFCIHSSTDQSCTFAASTCMLHSMQSPGTKGGPCPT